MRLKDFLEYGTFPASLKRAVIRQYGTWEEFQESAEDIANHGADSGFNGFIYYGDTCEFARKHKKEILSTLSDYGRECGEEVSEIIANFGIFRDYSQEEKRTLHENICKIIYGSKKDEKGNEDAESILNVLAWYALEETAREFVDMKENTKCILR